MAYVKILYQDSPSTATPINAHNLNHMDDQIALNDQRLSDLEGAHVSSFNGRTGAVTPAKGDYNIGQIAPLTGATVGQVPVVVNVGTEEDPELEFQMGAGGGGGHVIQNASGTDMPQESAMQFPDSHVSDDSVNGRTIVENVKSVASADYSSETEDGMYLIPDGEGAVIGPASDDKVEVVADGVKTYAELLNELYTKIDQTKLTNDTKLVEGNLIHSFNARSGGHYYFGSILFGSTSSEVGITIDVTSSQSKYVAGSISSATSVTDNSSTKPANGTKITLHYGNKKATVDLQTTANRCWMSNGESVESAINSISYKRAGFSGVTSSDGLLTLTGFEYSSGYRILLVEDCTLSNATYNIAHGSNPNYIVFKSIVGQSVANQNVTVIFWYKQI